LGHVEVVREEFGQGNEFCEKITYRTSTARVVEKVTDEHGQEVDQVTYESSGVKAEDLPLLTVLDPLVYYPATPFSQFDCPCRRRCCPRPKRISPRSTLR
jgi:hypothetical protein